MADTYSQIYIQIVFSAKGRQNLIRPEFKTEPQKYMSGIIKAKGAKNDRNQQYAGPFSYPSVFRVSRVCCFFFPIARSRCFIPPISRMKLSTVILFGAGALIAADAAVFEFDFGPGGMNGANQRPVPLLTTATGGELPPFFPEEPGISYDTSTHQLFLNFNWGADRGYTDLVGTFTGARIYGPADENSEGSALYSLTSLVNYISSGGHSAGVFQKAIQLVDNPDTTSYSVAQQEAQLFAGLWYINVQSNFAPSGEIRGQLIPVPEPRSYALVGSLMLLAFCAWRKLKTA